MTMCMQLPLFIETKPDQKKAEQFRKIAEGMIQKIYEKRHSATANLNPTRRRAAQIDSSMADADRMEELQNVLYGLADDFESGNIPPVLSGLNSKAAVEQAYFYGLHIPFLRVEEAKRYRQQTDKYSRDVLDLLDRLLKREAKYGWRIEITDEEEMKILAETEFSFYDLTEYRRMKLCGIDTEEKMAEAKLFMKAYQKPKSAEEKLKRKLTQMEHDLIGSKIPGFFPTPREVVELMVEHAMIEPGMKILEPSAGKGDIADVIREQFPDINIVTVELNYSLAEILKAKGYNVRNDDIMGCGVEIGAPFDRIVMNPPFENCQDVDHVLKVFELLKPGGRLVSIVGAGVFYRQGKKESAFRDWLDENCIYQHELESGTFTGSGAFRQTGVASRIIVVDKPE